MISAAQRKSAEGVGPDASCYFSQSSRSPAVLCEDHSNAQTLAQAQNSQNGEQTPPLASFPEISRGLGQSPSHASGESHRIISHIDILERNTGWYQKSDKYQESSKRQALLARQSKDIVDALIPEGIDLRLEGDQVTALGEVTGGTDSLDSYRSVCFLPVIAQRDRKPILNGLCYFQKHHPLGKYLRYAVVTSGERVPLYGDVRGTIQELNRRISRWASEARERYGIAVVFRGTEFTVNDDLTFHVHANVIYAPLKKLKGDKWSDFLAWSHVKLQAHWKDNRMLEKPQEAIKYPFKPLDLEKLDGKALAWLYRSMSGCHMVQPMGEFKEWRQSLEFEFVTKEVIDLETGEVTSVTEKLPRERKYKVGYLNTGNGPQLVKIEKQKRQPVDAAPPDNRDISTENMIVTRTAPQFRFSPYAEPVTLVQNYTETPVTPEGKLRLQKIKERRIEARKLWDANGAPDPAIALSLGKAQRAAAEGEARKVRPFNVHTSRSTVQRQKLDHYTNHPPGDTGKDNIVSLGATREQKIENFEKTKENQHSGNSPTP